jgi:hypothetical protein
MHTPVLSVVNLTSIVIVVVVLLSSILMNGAEVHVSRMLLLLAPVLASALCWKSLNHWKQYLMLEDLSFRILAYNRFLMIYW